LSKAKLSNREKDVKPGSSGGFFGQKRSLIDSVEDGNMIAF